MFSCYSAAINIYRNNHFHILEMNLQLPIHIVLLLCCAVTARLDPEEHMSTPEIIKFWGYPAESHWVTTPDGYILGIHRIPSGKSRAGRSHIPLLVIKCRRIYPTFQKQSVSSMILDHNNLTTLSRYPEGH